MQVEDTMKTVVNDAFRSEKNIFELIRFSIGDISQISYEIYQMKRVKRIQTVSIPPFPT